VKSSKGALDGENEIQVDGLHGREFFVKMSGSNYVRFRAFVNGRYTYSLQVWGKDKEAVKSQDADKFLKSFSVEE
jgi:hypothetical protein